MIFGFSFLWESHSATSSPKNVSRRFPPTPMLSVSDSSTSTVASSDVLSVYYFRAVPLMATLAVDPLNDVTMKRSSWEPERPCAKSEGFRTIALILHVGGLLANVLEPYTATIPAFMSGTPTRNGSHTTVKRLRIPMASGCSRSSSRFNRRRHFLPFRAIFRR